MTQDGFRALVHEFTVSAPDDPPVATHLARLFAAQRATVTNAHHYTFVPSGASGPFHYELRRDGQRIATASSAEGLVSPLVRHLNTEAIDSWLEGPICHAGGVVHDGRGLMLAADQEAGKTTLTAGLVRAGCDYLSDEAMAFDAGGVITPFPKPLSIDPGSWHLFPELEPHADLPSSAYKDDQWQVPVEAIRANAVGVACQAGWIVFPRYEAGAPTALEPVHRAEALIELARNTFHFADRSGDLLDQLADIVRDASCHRLVVGSLSEACRLLVSLVDAPLDATDVGR